MAKQITPKELKSKLDSGETLMLVDVREEWEIRRGMLPGAIHIVMDSIPDELERLPKDQPVVFICRSGGRSEAVANWVQGQGWSNVLNLSGGTIRWTNDVDPKFPGKY